MKTLPLIIANLKEFVRNWKSVLLLIVFPMILIILIFLSFNPNGLQTIPVGVIQHTDEFDLKEYEKTYFSFLDIRYYKSVNSCLGDLKIHREYICINISYESGVQLTVFYDNTQEPVIWEIIERIKSTVDVLQKQKSKEIAGDFLTEFKTTLKRVGTFKEELGRTNNEIDTYIDELDTAKSNQETAKTQLIQTLDSMNQDIDEIKDKRYEIATMKSDYHRDSKSAFNEFDRNVGDFFNLTYQNNRVLNRLVGMRYDLEDDVDAYSLEMDRQLIELDYKIREYEMASSRGEGYIDDIDDSIDKLEDTQSSLLTYKDKLSDSEDEITQIEKKFSVIHEMTPEKIVNPILLSNMPVYIPDGGEDLLSGNESKETMAEKVSQGLNLISLQTLFPTVLFLINLFLSLLISSFIALQNINSPANKRLRLIKGIFFPELISTYFSTIIILVSPILCVILAGHYLFKLNILGNFGLVATIMLLCTSNFILFGMILSYLVRKKSTTLLVCTFMLVFLIFLSGFLLPIERMSTTASTVADVLPSKLSFSAFNKLVFYNQDFYGISNDLFLLMGWFGGLSTLLVVTRLLRKS